MMAGSPAASVSVPTAISSSSKEKSHPAKRLSSRSDLSSAPSREDAPAITMRWDTRARGMNSRGPGNHALPDDAHELQDDATGRIARCGNHQNNFRIFPDYGD